MGRSISHLADTHAYQYAPACDFDQKIDKLLTCLRPKTLSTKHLTLEAGMSFTFTLMSRVKSPRKDLKRVFTPIKNGMTRDQYLFHLWIPPNLSSLFSYYIAFPRVLELGSWLAPSLTIFVFFMPFIYTTLLYIQCYTFILLFILTMIMYVTFVYIFRGRKALEEYFIYSMFTASAFCILTQIYFQYKFNT